MPSMPRFSDTDTARNRVTQAFRVQSYDVGAAGLANDAAYQRWWATLREALIAQALPGLPGAPMLVTTRAHYWHPLRVSDAFTGHIWLSSLGKARWTMQLKLVAGDRAIATATHIGHFLDPETLAPHPLPDTILQHYWETQWQQ